MRLERGKKGGREKEYGGGGNGATRTRLNSLFCMLTLSPGPVGLIR